MSSVVTTPLQDSLLDNDHHQPHPPLSTSTQQFVVEAAFSPPQTEKVVSTSVSHTLHDHVPPSDFLSGVIPEAERVTVAAKNVAVTIHENASWTNQIFKTTSKRKLLVVRGVSLIARPGEVVALLGGSGSGKTTLLNALAHRFDAESTTVEGEIAFLRKQQQQQDEHQPHHGHHLHLPHHHHHHGDQQSKKAHVYTRFHGPIADQAYVVQEDDLLPHLTVRETLRFAAALRLPEKMGEEWRNRRVEEVILQLGLKDCANTLVGEMGRGISGGEKRRVTIGIQLLSSPSLLFADEPTSGLDASSAFQLIQLLSNISKTQGRTVICSLHQPRKDIFHLFSSVVLLSKGEMVYSGPVASLESHFDRLGFPCPQYSNIADYILDISTVNHATPQTEKESNDRVAYLIENCPRVDFDPEVLEELEGGILIRPSPPEESIIADNKTEIKDVAAAAGIVTVLSPGGSVVGAWVAPPQSTVGGGVFASESETSPPAAAAAAGAASLSPPHVSTRAVVPINVPPPSSATAHLGSLSPSEEPPPNKIQKIAVTPRPKPESTINWKTEGEIHRAGWWGQTKVLTARGFTNLRRDKMTIFGGLLEVVLLSLMTGYIYYDLPRTPVGLRNIAALCYLSCSQQPYLIIVFTTYKMIKEMQIFDRERQDKMYGVIPYVLSLFLSSLPLNVIYSTFFSVILYFMAGLRMDGGGWYLIVFVLTNILLQNIAMSFATLCTCILRSYPNASVMGNSAVAMWSFTSGFFIQLSTFPVYVGWMRFTSFIMYGTHLLDVNQLRGLQFECPLPASDPVCLQYSGDVLLQQLGMDSDDFNGKHLPAILLCVLFVVFEVGQVLSLHFFPRSPIHDLGSRIIGKKSPAVERRPSLVEGEGEGQPQHEEIHEEFLGGLQVIDVSVKMKSTKTGFAFLRKQWEKMQHRRRFNNNITNITNNNNNNNNNNNSSGLAVGGRAAGGTNNNNNNNNHRHFQADAEDSSTPLPLGRDLEEGWGTRIDPHLHIGGGPDEHEGKVIVRNVNVFFPRGQLSVILGGSGSGKTSFLNSIAGRLAKTQKRHGRVLADGREIKGQERNLIGYVTQHDELLPLLSAFETLNFAAALRLPKHYDSRKRISHVEGILSELNLRPAKDVRVGKKGGGLGLSGGERRRLSIALALLTKPPFLLLDEPTTGLDAGTAGGVIRSLHTLAHTRRGGALPPAVVAVLHQPRADILHLFDNILVFSQGHVVFNGKGGDLLPFLASGGAGGEGLICPPKTNPADFIIDVSTVDVRNPQAEAVSRRRVAALIRNYQQSSSVASGGGGGGVTTLSSTHQPSDVPSSPPRYKLPKKDRISTFSVYLILLKRSLINAMRQPDVWTARTLQVVSLGGLVALFFSPLPSSGSSVVQNRIGLVYETSVVIFVGMLNCFASFPVERAVFDREHAEGSYGVLPFFLSYVTIELFFEVISGVLFALLVGIAPGLLTGGKAYILLVYASVCLINVGESIGMAVFSLVENLGFSIHIISLCLGLLGIMGGLLAVDMPIPLQRFNKISVAVYFTDMISFLAFDDLQIDCTEEEFATGICPFRTGNEVLESYQIGVHSISHNVMMLGIITLIVRLAALFLMYLRKWMRWG